MWYWYVDGCGPANYVLSGFEESELRYFRKGTETWGNPHTFNTGLTDGIPESIHIYPNPAENELSIGNPENRSLSLTLMTINGQHVSTSESSKETRISIDVSSLPSGLYMLRIEDEDGSVVSRKVAIR